MICHASAVNRVVERVPTVQRHPVRIGELMPEVLAKYGVTAERPARQQRRSHPMAAAWLGQQTLAGLELRT